jgi:hypothetical protein
MRIAVPLAAALVLSACLTPGPRALPAPDPGFYRFVALNGRPAPVEFPPFSGALIESGTLDLQPGGRFALRFVGKGSGGGPSEPSGHEGRWHVASDTLYFVVDGLETRPPVWFRFARDDRRLRLTDRAGNEWAYARR